MLFCQENAIEKMAHVLEMVSFCCYCCLDDLNIFLNVHGNDMPAIVQKIKKYHAMFYC